MGEAMTWTVRAGKTSSFEKKNGIVYRVFHDMARGGATTRQVVLPESLRKYVLDLRERLEGTLKLAQEQLKLSQAKQNPTMTRGQRCDASNLVTRC